MSPFHKQSRHLCKPDTQDEGSFGAEASKWLRELEKHPYDITIIAKVEELPKELTLQLAETVRVRASDKAKTDLIVCVEQLLPDPGLAAVVAISEEVQHNNVITALGGRPGLRELESRIRKRVTRNSHTEADVFFLEALYKSEGDRAGSYEYCALPEKMSYAAFGVARGARPAQERFAWFLEQFGWLTAPNHGGRPLEQNTASYIESQRVHLETCRSIEASLACADYSPERILDTEAFVSSVLGNAKKILI